MTKKKDKDKPKLAYSVPEMAEALSIGTTKAYALVKRDDFPKVKVGERIIVPISGLQRWLDKESAKAVQV